MLKAQIFRRGFSLWTGVPYAQVARSAARDGHETVTIQRVRIKRPFFSRSRVIGTALTTTAAYAFLRWIDDIEDEDEEDEGEAAHTAPRLRRESGMDGAETDWQVAGEDEGEEEEALLFFPTGLSRAKPQTYYKGSDPEWQEFVRLAPDKERTKKIRMDLVSMIRSMAANSPSYQKRLGQVRPDAGNHWVEIRFPDSPPLEYERPGFEITEDMSIRRATRPVQEIHHRSLENALFPAAAANSLYADTKWKIAKNWQDFRTYIGWEDESAEQKETLVKIITLPPLAPKGQTTTSPTASPSTSGASAPSSATSAERNPPSSAQRAPAESVFGNTTLERLLPSLPPPSKLTLDLSKFQQDFRKERVKHVKIQPPRGTVMVSGLVEIVGSRARMTLDVTGAYDPKLGKYVLLKVALRSIVDHKQYPKGGH